MAKRRVTFEADTSELFDNLARVGDGGAALGSRMVACLLAEESWREATGLAFYGVEIVTGEDGDG